MSKLTLISSATASGAASISFTSGIDSTYNEYVFYFVNINPATNATNFSFQVNASGGSGFNEDITSTAFLVYQNEAGTATHLGYWAGGDQSLGSSYQVLSDQIGSGADEGCSGELRLFNPASTTYVKHFMSRSNSVYPHSGGPFCMGAFMGGYIMSTAAITEISFKQSSGNLDGNIYMFGAS